MHHPRKRSRTNKKDEKTLLLSLSASLSLAFFCLLFPSDLFSPPRSLSPKTSRPHKHILDDQTITRVRRKNMTDSKRSNAAGEKYALRGIYGSEPYWPQEKLKICVTGAGGFIGET
jgi:hypothetical protein